MKFTLNIFHDFNNPGSIVYFIILTSIFIVSLFYGNTLIFKVTTNRYAHFCFAFLLILLYVIFLGIYFLKWTIEGIFIMLMVFSILLGIAAFIILYFGDQICREMEKEGERKFLGYVLVVLTVAVLVLTFYHRKGQYEWYDLVKFVIILVLIRIMYYIIKRENYQYVKTILDIFLVYIIYREGRKIYEVWKG